MSEDATAKDRELYELLAQVNARAERAEAVAAAERTRAERAEARAEIAEAVVAEERALSNGTYFSTIEDVWSSLWTTFQIDASFVRSHHVVDPNNRYEKTVEAAKKNGNNEETATTSGGSNASNNSSRSKASSAKVDIFGKKADNAESAHLLPHASICASYWYPVVPWVLCTGNEKLSWEFTQKCIHGSTNEAAAQSKKSKLQYVGIKHFPSNRIRLTSQATYLDKSPCIIIAPILSLAGVINWNGEAYDAIILAGDWKENYIEAARVYQSIAAVGNMLEDDKRIAAVGNMLEDDKFEKYLANEEQCNLACDLIKQMVLCTYQAFRNSRNNKDFYDDMKSDSEAKKFNAWESQLLDTCDTAPVPISNGWNPAKKVRKISFSKYTVEKDSINPAPDPVLLLARATSNWLKRQNIEILPACGGDDSSCTDSSMDSIISFSEEARIRGLSHTFDTAKKPCIAEIDINLIYGDAWDEPLSDDE